MIRQKAIIIDIDGTLAHMKGRIKRWGAKAPYKDEDAQDDELDGHVAHMVRTLSKEFAIVICSGRKDSSKNILIKWLEEYNIPYSDLFMRSYSDNRKDSIVKKELFEKYISKKYDVWLVFDDRNQVVKMWRDELGLKCFQVADGAF